MKDLDVTWYCNKYVTPDVVNIISVEKGLYVAESCQVQNIPTDNCGSKLISLFLLILKIFDVIYYFFGKNHLISLRTILMLSSINVTF
jgi:hypothetical protein